MKREEIDAILKNAEMDDKKKVDEIFKLHGANEEEHKAKVKELEEKVKSFETLQSENETLKKQVEEYGAFKEKATKYDEILPTYEKFQADAKHQTRVDMAKKLGIHESFIELAIKNIPEDSEDYEKALTDFVTKYPTTKAENFAQGSSSQEHGNGGEKKLEELSDADYVAERMKGISKEF